VLVEWTLETLFHQPRYRCGFLCTKGSRCQGHTSLKSSRHLQDIAPIAVFSPYDSLAERFTAPAPWKTFGGLAKAALGPDGMGAPTQCRKVFEFAAVDVEDPQAARDRLQHDLIAMEHGFKGRYRALPLPPIHQALPAAQVPPPHLWHSLFGRIALNGVGAELGKGSELQSRLGKLVT